MFQAVNPATEEVIGEYDEHSDQDVQQRLEAAEKTFASWRQTSFAERAKLMRQAASLLRQRKDKYAQLMTAEMGKPITGSEGEVDKCAWVCEFYADHAEQFLAPRQVDTDARHSYVRYDPIGAVLAVMPWNFPFWQVFRFAAPGLMAGNVGLLKHAANVPGSALAIEEVFREAGLPEGAFQTLLITSKKVANVIAHPTVKAVTLTGSEKAGMAVASQAGEQIKKTVLELGGSDPFIVLKDARVEEAATQAVKARTINTGQSCIAAKRFIVEEAVADRFSEAMVQQTAALSMGDPTKRETDLGPLARDDLRDQLHDQVERSVQAGARLLQGGKMPGGKGYFYPATVLGEVTPEMPAFEEETFGPVAAIIRARDGEHAVELANQSDFGLGASVWTQDRELAGRLAARIQSGAVFVNSIVKSDPRLPFGGVKRSGYGRELADVGICEFVNIKSVWVD